MASFRFYGNLNDFLPKRQREVAVLYQFTGSPAVKDAIEALGVPHAEVAIILADEIPVDFNYKLKAGDKIEVFPKALQADFPEACRLLPALPEPISFILDVHLGKLARNLRLVGLDSFYEKDYGDKQLAELATSQNRVVLTRDVGLLKLKRIEWGYWLRSQNPEEQLLEVVKHYNLVQKLQPFTRCLACNGLILPVTKASVLDELPPKTRMYFTDFYQCSDCRRVYWKGSHYGHMQLFLQKYYRSGP